MRICFVSGQTVQAFLEKGGKEEADLFLFGNNGIGEVCYEQELNGKTNSFEKIALLSQKTQSVLISGCTTNTMGHCRRSAVIAEKGRLKGVSDSLYTFDEKISIGANLRIYETGLGRIGIVVGEDLQVPEVIKALSDCGSDWIVCTYGNMCSHLPSTLLRANAYFYGTPILFCAESYAMIATPKGELAFASPCSPVVFEYKNRAEYHFIQRRKKGIR